MTRICFLSFLIMIAVFRFAQSSQINEEEYRYLDEIALRAGADKASNYHNYTEVYAG